MSEISQAIIRDLGTVSFKSYIFYLPFCTTVQPVITFLGPAYSNVGLNRGPVPRLTVLYCGRPLFEESALGLASRSGFVEGG